MRRAAWAAFVGLALLAAPLHAKDGAHGKLVVLGFDGADAGVTQELMDAGKLPNLAALAKEGGFRPLLPTNPPQTPVSWSTFATGLNPGRTEIFDFLKRRTNTYLPAYCAYEDSVRRPFLWGAHNGPILGLLGASCALVPLLFALALRRARKGFLVTAGVLAVVGGSAGGYVGARLLPSSIPAPLNNRKGRTFWEAASDHGLTCRVLRVPMTFPADRYPGLTMLSGLGVPDMRGTNGQPTVYTTRANAAPGQFAVRVMKVADTPGQPVSTVLEGPRNLLFPPKTPDAPDPRLTVPLSLTALPGGRVRITAGDRTSELDPGQWSDWHVVTFRFNVLVRSKGMVRFYNQSRVAASGAPGFTEVVMTPVNFHPDTAALVGWCHPSDYAKRLSARLGLFKTLGWSSDTWTVTDGLAAEDECLSDIDYTTGRFEALMESQLADPGVDVFVQVFEFTDRVQHVFWRLGDPQHPGYDASIAARYPHAVEDAYVRMDGIVGRARQLAPKDATFVVLSDHGFTSFRRGVNLNRWLVDHGYMVLKSDPCAGAGARTRNLDDLFGNQTPIFAEVDWSKTRAYALGLGSLYVNLAGREPQGSVRPGAEYDELTKQLQDELPQLVDATTGEHPVRRVYRRDEMYQGYDPELVPDLRVANGPHYRVSWDTSLGGYPCQEIESNLKAWGGDHCSVDPEVVKGILFVNRPLHDEAPSMVDVAPSLLGALGLPPEPGCDGKAVF